jgi:[ribosomal protein S5]-alanine N-acetyltransferase
MENHLLTKRLLLRPFGEADIYPFYDICSNPNVMRYIGNGSLPTLEDIEQSIRRWIAQYKDEGYSLQALVYQKTNALMGFCGFLNQEINGQLSVELGYRLGEAYWGKGFATEAASAMRDHGFHTLQLKKLISVIQPANNASCRVAEKLGLTLLGEYEHQGQPVLIYQLTQDDFFKKSSSNS